MNKKKAFTLVELLIVIAILAILAAVSVVGYTSFIKKAKLSDDEVLVTQWNKLLQGNEILEEEKFTSASKAREYLKLNGAKEEEFTPKADGYHFYWNKDDNRIYLIKDDDPNTAVFPENSSVKNAINPFDKNYLTFTAEEAGATVTPKFSSGDWAYSFNGKDWIDIKSTDTTNYNNKTIPLTNVGDKVMLRGTNCISGGASFTMTGKIAASGSVTSLTDGVGINPNVILSENCYYGMFSNCKYLTTAPELPAITLAKLCYKSMFQNCTSLTIAPKLPASILAVCCYESMLSGCTSLTIAPELPATSLANYCYKIMFLNCTSLTTAPELPAQTLFDGCYQQMFSGCTSLTTAPELPATELKTYCYNNMFNGCLKLKVSITSGNKIFKCPSNIPTDAVSSMFYNCATNGGLTNGTPTADTDCYWN